MTLAGDGSDASVLFVGIHFESECLDDFVDGSGSHGDAAVLGIHRKQREHATELIVQRLERRHC